MNLENVNIKAITAIGGAVFVVGSALGFSAWMQSMSNRLEALQTQMGDRYTLTMAAENALRTAIENPGLKIPDPRNPGQFFTVKVGSQNPTAEGR